MNLSQDLFQQIVTTLAAGEATNLPNITLPAGQRRGPRFTAESGTRVRLIPLTDAIAPGPLDVRLRDVSPGGAGFVFSLRIPLDEQFVLLLPSQDGDVAVLCAVAYWQPLSEDAYAIGARFTRVLRQGSTQPAPRVSTPVGVPVRQAV